MRVVTEPPAPKKPPYVFQPYPKMKYHRVHKPAIAKDAAAEEKLGPEWADKEFPAEVPIPGAPCPRCEAVTQKFEGAYKQIESAHAKLTAEHAALVDEHNQLVEEQAALAEERDKLLEQATAKKKQQPNLSQPNLSTLLAQK